MKGLNVSTQCNLEELPDENDNKIKNQKNNSNFEIVMLGRIVIDRVRYKLKNLGKWHIVDMHKSEDYNIY